MSSTKLYWNDTRHTGMLGGKKLIIHASLQESDPEQDDDPMDARAVIYSVGEDEQLILLRWAVGASVELPTNNLIHAKNAVMAMLRMETNDG